MFDLICWAHFQDSNSYDINHIAVKSKLYLILCEWLICSFIARIILLLCHYINFSSSVIKHFIKTKTKLTDFLRIQNWIWQPTIVLRYMRWMNLTHAVNSHSLAKICKPMQMWFKACLHVFMVNWCLTHCVSRTTMIDIRKQNRAYTYNISGVFPSVHPQQWSGCLRWIHTNTSTHRITLWIISALMRVWPVKKMSSVSTLSSPSCCCCCWAASAVSWADCFTRDTR